MTAATDYNYAKYLAHQHNMFIADVIEKGRPAYVLYRRAAPGETKNVKIGRRATAALLLSLVKDTIGQPA